LLALSCHRASRACQHTLDADLSATERCAGRAALGGGEAPLQPVLTCWGLPTRAARAPAGAAPPARHSCGPPPGPRAWRPAGAAFRPGPARKGGGWGLGAPPGQSPAQADPHSRGEVARRAHCQGARCTSTSDHEEHAASSGGAAAQHAEAASGGPSRAGAGLPAEARVCGLAGAGAAGQPGAGPGTSVGRAADLPMGSGPGPPQRALLQHEHAAPGQAAVCSAGQRWAPRSLFMPTGVSPLAVPSRGTTLVPTLDGGPAQAATPARADMGGPAAQQLPAGRASGAAPGVSPGPAAHAGGIWPDLAAREGSASLPPPGPGEAAAPARRPRRRLLAAAGDPTADAALALGCRLGELAVNSGARGRHAGAALAALRGALARRPLSLRV